MPELSYQELAVHEGQTAQRIWMDVALSGKYAERREQIFHDLLEYCALDTLAMVRIYEKLCALTPSTVSVDEQKHEAISLS